MNDISAPLNVHPTRVEPDSPHSQVPSPADGADDREVVHLPRQRPTVSKPFRAYLFGPFRVFRGDMPVDRHGKRRQTALTLLTWFLLDPTRPRSLEELADLCWPDVPPEKSISSVHVAMHCLRRMLEPDLRPRQASSYILRAGNNSYSFDADEWWIDTDETQRLFDLGRLGDQRGNLRSARFYYSRVVAYAARHFLEDTHSEHRSIQPYRTHYEGLRVHSLVRLIQLHRRDGELEESREYAEQLLHINPYNEFAAYAIIEAQLAHGQNEDASRTWRSFVSSLEHDLGATPSAEVLDLCDRIPAGPLPENRIA